MNMRHEYCVMVQLDNNDMDEWEYVCSWDTKAAAQQSMQQLRELSPEHEYRIDVVEVTV